MADEMMQTEKGSRNKKFMRDLGIYAIGNLGSKLITFLLVPFYTQFITTPAEFGYYDICLTIIFCLTPIVSLQLNDGGFRFLLESESRKRQRGIVTIVYRTLLTNSMILAAVSLVVGFTFDIRYLSYIVIYGIIQSVYETVIQLVRGLGHTKTFVGAAVFNSFLIAGFSVIFVAVLPWGVPGIFIANICAKLVTMVWLEFKVKLIREYFKPSQVERGLLRQLLRYSLPLLPGTLCWWLLGANNRFFIEHYLGLSDNGLYAVAMKFAGTMNILVMIFYQTWQQNAIEQYKSQDRDTFYSKIFNTFILLFSAVIIIFSFGLRLNYSWLVGPEYQTSSRYVYLIALSIVIYGITMLYDLGYQCSKNTHRSLPSVFIGTSVNILCNFILIQHLGIYGIVWSSIITYTVMMIYRAIDTRKYFKITFTVQTLWSTITIIVCGLLYTYTDSATVDAAAIIICAVIYSQLLPGSIRDRILRKLHLGATS